MQWALDVESPCELMKKNNISRLKRRCLAFGDGEMVASLVLLSFVVHDSFDATTTTTCLKVYVNRCLFAKFIGVTHASGYLLWPQLSSYLYAFELNSLL